VNRVPLADQLVWPRLVRPRRPIVYLDLNHFIGMALAIAAAPRTPAGYGELFEAARAAIEEERIIIPLSGEHLFEMAAIKDPKQRNDLADVMEVLSGFQYLVGRPEIAHLEIEAGIEAILEEQPHLRPVSLIGPSFGWAFGRRGGMRIVDADGNDASGAARKEMGAERYDEVMRYVNYSVERGILAGPQTKKPRAFAPITDSLRRPHKRSIGAGSNSNSTSRNDWLTTLSGAGDGCGTSFPPARLRTNGWTQLTVSTTTGPVWDEPSST
jgi:hypothetical protein